MAIDGARGRWGVEVVRGREPGRRYVLAEGETTVGNAPGPAPGHLSLADQEGASPRRMTGKQAALIVSGGRLAIRDLDGPGGTFVNHQRLLSGVDRPLAPGDEVQLGGVRLVVRRESEGAAPRPPSPPSAPPPPPAVSARSGPLGAPYAFPGGVACRSWDDFLALAAQRWSLVRDELASGRIAEHLRRVGRADLLPRKSAGWSADDMLDDWLGRLPAIRSSAPELDVHPEALVVRAAGGGGTVRRTIRISNVGYRLLRSTVRVESTGPGRARLLGGGEDGSFATIDETDVELEIDLPEGGGEGALGAIVVESNGGSRRIEIRLERARAEVVSLTDDDSSAGLPPTDFAGLFSPARRLWLFPLVLVGAHVLTGGGESRLATLAVVGSVLGFLVGTALGAARGGDVGASGFAGAAGGLLTSALAFAAVRSADGLVGPSFAAGPAAVILWALVGVGLALASWVAFPARKEEGA